MKKKMMALVLASTMAASLAARGSSVQRPHRHPGGFTAGA